MLEVGIARVAYAYRHGAVAVADLHQPTQRAAGPVPRRFIPVITFTSRDRGERNRQREVTDVQAPCPVPVRRPGARAGDGGHGSTVPWLAGFLVRGCGRAIPPGFAASGGFAVSDGPAQRVGHDDLEHAARVPGGLRGQPPGQGGIQDAEAVRFAGPAGQANSRLLALHPHGFMARVRLPLMARPAPHPV